MISFTKYSVVCVVSSIHRTVNKIVAVLGCYTELLVSLTDNSGKLTVSHFQIKQYKWTTYSLNMGPLGVLDHEERD